MKKTAIFLVVLISTVSTLSAQSKWKYEFGFGGTFNSGNVNNVSLKSTANIDRNDSVLAFNANARYLYSAEQKVTTNEGIGGGIKFDINQYDKWSPFFAAEFITNHFKGYDFKISFLGGVKYRIYTVPDLCDYSISGALVGDYVNYHITDPVADTLDGMLMRISLRGKIKQRIGANTRLNHSTFWQPAVKDFGDYLVTSITKIENKLNEHFFFDVIFEYEYRSFVPEGRKKHDYMAEIAFRIKF